jgi:hypothetical protein
MWMRYPGGDRGGADYGWRGKHVVHGHDSHSAPLRLAHRTDLDGRAWALGKLYVGVFDDERAGVPWTFSWPRASRATATRVDASATRETPCWRLAVGRPASPRE